MTPTFARALVALLPALGLLALTAARFGKAKTVGRLLMSVGAIGLVIVVLTHIAEGLQIFPMFRWGQPDSVGHYIDLSAASLSVILLPLGLVCDRFVKRR